jgi:hypothetical protein
VWLHIVRDNNQLNLYAKTLNTRRAMLGTIGGWLPGEFILSDDDVLPFFPLKSIHNALIEPCFEQQGVTPWVSGMEQSRRDDLQVPREAEAIASDMPPTVGYQ